MSFFNLINLSKNVTTICSSVAHKAFHSVRVQQQVLSAAAAAIQQQQQQQQQQNVSGVVGVGMGMGMGMGMGVAVRQLHTTAVRRDLMEFFDDPKNWKENEIKGGRAWKKDELRIKSNKELHQLWYVLLKERNMLLTMEHECNDKMELFPSPDRLDKVKISMSNLETVVRERNKAYHLLETGETGERPSRYVANDLGIRYLYKSCEHVLPPHLNVKWIKSRPIGFGGKAVRKFLLLYREKLYNEKRKAKNRSRNEVMMMLRRNPNMDVAMLRNKYPGVDVEKLQREDKTRGHFVTKVEQ